MRGKSLLLLTTVFLGMTIGTAYGHVTVQPKQSAAGAVEKYTMRVPTEKFVPTVRVEVKFPPTLEVTSFESKPGWKIEEKKGASGKLIGVTLTGSIPTGESASFDFSARNPKEEGKLYWKVIQIYQDGSKSEWTGAEGSRTPAPGVEVKR
ncbi:MAG TPA: DUF1775 domain-containing protein [Terriglobia bacterium]|nr:DUF1775 domain-containing protein [Terriglobia bacterium]